MRAKEKETVFSRLCGGEGCTAVVGSFHLRHPFNNQTWVEGFWRQPPRGIPPCPLAETAILSVNSGDKPTERQDEGRRV